MVLTLVATSTSQFTSFALTGNTLVLQAQGAPNAIYILQAAPHVNAPIPWLPIRTNTADGAGQIELITPDITVQPAQFYRLTTP